VTPLDLSAYRLVMQEVLQEVIFLLRPVHQEVLQQQVGLFFLPLEMVKDLSRQVEM
jgi:hypothetical protein